MNTDLEDIGPRVWSFLETAMTSRDPDRDIPASKAITAAFVDTAPTDPQDWNAARFAAVGDAAQALAGHPHRWNQAVKLSAIYLSSDWRRAHPLADMATSRGADGEQQLHPVRVNLHTALLEALLDDASPTERVAFLASVDDWAVIHAIEKSLPSAGFTSNEIAAFLARLCEFGRGDLATGKVLGTISDWAKQDHVTAKSVVASWLDDRGEYRSITPPAVQALVAGVVAGTADLEWRDTVITRLVARRTEKALKLAARLACFAWPPSDDPKVAKRHAALIAQAQEFPEILVPTAIWAVQFDARKYPLASFETALQLRGLLPDEIASSTAHEASDALAAVTWQAALGAKEAGVDRTAFLHALDYLLDFPATQRVTDLDAVLEELVDVGEAEVRDFLAKWLVHNASAITETMKPLEDLFPELAQRAPARADAWLLSWMVAGERSLRHVAVELFAKRRSPRLAEAATATLSRFRAQGLAHVLAENLARSATVWIPALVDLGRARPELLELVERILLEDAIEQYPGVLRSTVRRWATEEPWASASTRIQERLEAQNQLWKAKGTIPELFAICPAYMAWQERQQVELDKASRAAERQSIFRVLATKMPIARGAASNLSGNPDQTTPFDHYQFSGELPALDLLDPVEAGLRRLLHRQELEKLLARADQEERAATA